jgi:3-methylfumaryl-CoA hydratase
MDDFEQWIGSQTISTDLVTERLVHEFCATIGDMPEPADNLLPGIHWCLAPDIRDYVELGRDAHPRLGLLLPDLGLPRRMWAGGKVEFHGPLRAGETVKRTSTIRDIAMKSGRSGPLGFITVAHDYEVNGETRVAEEQIIVYREEGIAGRSAPPAAEAWETVASQEITPQPPMLFRYSAISFNGHRIHYDHPYATGVEGYEGLVVHGPMQATWMQVMATSLLGRLPASFSYRGLSPLICGRKASIEARHSNTGLELRVLDISGGFVTMQAEAS